ncbi:hypothetical protein L202_08180 [Cryptococcus amylolentus CBS 6039]|uniref:Uncharacterized protein n=1 Tax=Cryptococcus amylolentus CBS 6039 TaxID=1295533 RepID=A0A1E3H8V5_9TREE|nr:hypothetical protein L202_08180 [Cryptococcus amylolentus CBS 6039]ODN72743.1 hypothetical protein L202_08180 [Cryptococcus amylolentus CBS 6039]
MFTTQKRRKTNRKNVYGHRTREFVHGYIDEKQQTLALEVLNSFTQPHYVPPPQDLQFVLYLITSPSEFPSVPPSLPFHALDRLLHTHNPLDIAPSIPSCSSAILPTNTHTTAKKTAEFRDALPAYLGWDYDRGGMDKAIWKRMRRCRDEGLWELMYEEPEKGKGRGEQTSPLTTPSSLRDGEDDEESPTAQRRLSMPGWRLLQWFVAVCEKDTALHAPRGVPYSPVFLRQIKKPYDSTGQMQRSEAEPIMGILREAFEIDDEETETDFESTPEEEEEDDDGVEKSEKELEKIEVERAKRAERARQRRERYREMILSGLQKQELAIRLLSLLVTTATNPSAIPTPETTHPSRDSSPTPSDSAERSAPLTPPTSSPSRTPSLTPAPAPPSSSSKAPFHTDTLSSHLIHLSSSLSSPRAREKMLQGWQGAEGVEWGPKSHLCALWVEHWAGVGKVKADERRRGRGRRGGKKAEKALEWKKGWCGMSAPTVEYLLELLGMSASGKDLATQQILLQSKLALVSVLNENKDVYLENEDRVEISRQWQKVKGKVGKSLEIGGKGIDATAVKSLHRVGQFVVHAVDNLFM